MTISRNFAVVSVLIAAAASRSAAQVIHHPPGDTVAPGVVRIVPGPSYGTGSLGRAILGNGWRDLWITPVSAPLFDLDTFAGGVRIDKRGGGFQTITLHLTEKNGWKEYRFRSVDKYPYLRLPRALAGTVLGDLIQDQTGNLFPAAPLIVPPFVAAVGGLHVGADLYVMPDDPALGKYRETFAGMLGTVELKGKEAPDDKPGFAGSAAVKDTKDFFEDLEKGHAHRLDEREFLAARLIDFLINDTDRTPDNYDWARFGVKGDYRWRPIARDRDRAFTNGSGLLNTLIVRRIYPKFTTFDAHYDLRGLTHASYAFDRRLLQRLTARDFADVAHRVQAAVTDSVIDDALAGLPREWQEQQPPTVDRLRSALVARRNGLADAAMRFYAELAGEPDIHLTADDERVEIVRQPNGSVTVTVPRVGPRPTIVAAAADAPAPFGGATRTMNGEVESPAEPFYRRTFVPAETKEIRVYLGAGSDTAIVRGTNDDAIVVRVIGGKDDDVLADSAGGGGTYLYDSDGDNRFVGSRDTHVDQRSWTPPEEVTGFTIGGAWRPDWGQRRGWGPVVRYAEGAGLVVGAGPRVTQYGFRRLPYRWRAGAALLVGMGNGRLGLTADADYRFENSPLGAALAARATQYEAFRFYGYGNQTPDIGGDLSLVRQNVVSIEPALTWEVGWRRRESKGAILHDFENTTGPSEAKDTTSGRRAVVGRIKAGPVVTWTDPQAEMGSPLEGPGIRGADKSVIAGLGLGLDLDGTDRDPVPTSGWRVRGKLGAYPVGVDQPSFGNAVGSVATYLPLGWKETHLALRAGGAVASGDYPAAFAANVGGSSSLRGYRSRRFAGDRSANASAEVRMPVGALNFLVRSDVGLIALADAGRVWLNGQSDGGWHTSAGGGIWFAALGRAVTLTWAHGEHHRFYFTTGLPF
jgi:hypothetical protein